MKYFIVHPYSPVTWRLHLKPTLRCQGGDGHFPYGHFLGRTAPRLTFPRHHGWNIFPPRRQFRKKTLQKYSQDCECTARILSTLKRAPETINNHIISYHLSFVLIPENLPRWNVCHALLACELKSHAYPLPAGMRFAFIFFRNSPNTHYFFFSSNSTPAAKCLLLQNSKLDMTICRWDSICLGANDIKRGKT